MLGHESTLWWKEMSSHKYYSSRCCVNFNNVNIKSLIFKIFLDIILVQNTKKWIGEEANFVFHVIWMLEDVCVVYDICHSLLKNENILKKYLK
jgi:hypothetical protein